MLTELAMVEEFHRKHHLDIRGPWPEFESRGLMFVAKRVKEQSQQLEIGIQNTRFLYSHLITEETSELLEALAQRDKAATAQELADIIYSCLGCAIAFGIPISRVFDIVHQHNMSKEVVKNGPRVKHAEGHLSPLAKIRSIIH